MNDMQEILKFYYGMNNKEAREYEKKLSESAKESLKKGYEGQCKRAFYED